MKVAYFAGSLKRNLDGVSRVLYKISEYNKQNGIDSIFISPETDTRLENKQLKLSGIRLPGYKEYKLNYTLPGSIIRMLKEENFIPDLIHIHSPCTTGLAGILVANHFNCPILSTYHTHFTSYLKYHRLSVMEKTVQTYLRKFYSSSRLVIIPSDYLVNELTSIGVHNLRVLPHGVDHNLFNPDSERRSDTHRKIKLLYAGRLVKEKNLLVLSRAIIELDSRNKNLEWWFAGQGVFESKLRSLLPQAIFLGFCDDSRLAQVYKNCDLFVFPSETETFGNVVLEAMASGCCCVVSNKRGAGDLITDRVNGLHVDSSSVHDVVEKIQFLLDNPSIRNELALNASKTSQEFNWERILSTQHEWYKLIIENEKLCVNNRR